MKVKEAKAAEKSVFPCKDIMEGVPMESYMKVDYKPAVRCSGQPNDSDYLPA